MTVVQASLINGYHTLPQINDCDIADCILALNEAALHYATSSTFESISLEMEGARFVRCNIASQSYSGWDITQARMQAWSHFGWGVRMNICLSKGI
jgi:hypothetical protein